MQLSDQTPPLEWRGRGDVRADRLAIGDVVRIESIAEDQLLTVQTKVVDELGARVVLTFRELGLRAFDFHRNKLIELVRMSRT